MSWAMSELRMSGGCLGVAPALSHALDKAGVLPENLLIQELGRSQFKLSRMAPERGQN